MIILCNYIILNVSEVPGNHLSTLEILIYVIVMFCKLVLLIHPFYRCEDRVLGIE